MKKNFIKITAIFLAMFLAFSNFSEVYADTDINNPSNNSVMLNEENSYITGYINNNGEITIYEHKDNYSDRVALTTVAVYVGGILTGYISASIVDGIVISATGKSGGQWVASAIKQIVGKRYKKGMSVYLKGKQCNYPPNSQMGANCK